MHEIIKIISGKSSEVFDQITRDFSRSNKSRKRTVRNNRNDPMNLFQLIFVLLTNFTGSVKASENSMDVDSSEIARPRDTSFTTKRTISEIVEPLNQKKIKQDFLKKIENLASLINKTRDFAHEIQKQNARVESMNQDARNFLGILYNLQYMLRTNSEEMLQEAVMTVSSLRFMNLMKVLRGTILNGNPGWVASLLNNQEHANSILEKQSIGELFTVLALDSLVAVPEGQKRTAYHCIDLVNDLLGAQLERAELRRIKDMIIIDRRNTTKEEKLNEVREWATRTIRNFIQIRAQASKFKDKVYFMRDWNIPQETGAGKLIVDSDNLKIIDLCFKSRSGMKIKIDETHFDLTGFSFDEAGNKVFQKIMEIFDFSQMKGFFLSGSPILTAANEEIESESGIRIILEIFRSSAEVERFTLLVSGEQGMIPGMINGLAEVLKTKRKISFFDISFCEFGPTCTSMLIQSLQNCRNIQLINVSGNSIRNTAEQTAGVRNFVKSLKGLQGEIEEFRISKNNLNAFDVAAIVNELRGKNLKRLVLDQNNISSNGPNNRRHYSCNRTECSHRHNNESRGEPKKPEDIECFRSLARGLYNLESLEEFSISGNNLDSSTIVFFLRHLTDLKKLDISWNKGKFNENTMFQFLNQIQTRHPHLSYLDISDNAINLNFLTTLFVAAKNLVTLKASFNPLVWPFDISDQQEEMHNNRFLLKAAISDAKNLEELEISECNLEIGDISVILEGLASTKIKKLNISENLPRVEEDDESVYSELEVERFANGLRNLTGLTELLISENVFGSTAVPAIVQSISHLRNLTFLDMTSITMSVKSRDEAEEIFQKVGKLEKLEYLLLSRNHIDFSHVKILNKHLAKLMNLKELYLQSTHFAEPDSSDESVDIPSGFGDLKRLETLDLSISSFSKKEMMEILGSLRNAKVLNFLDISACDIEIRDQKEADELIEQILKLESLSILMLNFNRISPALFPIFKTRLSHLSCFI